MADSPFVPQHIADYILKNQIEENIESCVNAVLENTPDNPYNYFTSYFSKMAGGEMTLLGLKAFKLLPQDGYHLLFSVSYRDNVYNVNSDVQSNLSEQEALQDTVTLINGAVRDKLVGSDICSTKKIDSLLEEFGPQVSH